MKNHPLRSAAALPPTMARHLFDTNIEAWEAIGAGVVDYWKGAFKRRATPWTVAEDAMRWWTLASERAEPTWSSPNELVLHSEIAGLRDFSDGSRARVIPTLVLPPQAGHHSCIVDYSAEQSQMQVIRAAGLERAFAMEWIGATQQTRNAGVTDCLDFLGDAVDLIGEPVNLIGDCQGGWLAMIYAALHPERINTLTLAGAPIDFHAGDGPIPEWVKLFCRTGDISFYEHLVRLGGGVMKGSFILDGFVTIKPDAEVGRQVQLLANLDDPHHVERYREFENWFKHTQDLPGAFYLWIVQHLFRDNELIAGDLKVGGKRVDLGRFDKPLYLLAGATDHITPPPQVFAARDAVATPASDIVEATTTGGHLGLFMGHEALREYWPPILAGVAERSRQGGRSSSAERRARAATPAQDRELPAA